MSDPERDRPAASMATMLGDVVKQHHAAVLEAQRARHRLRDRRAELEAELRTIDSRIAEADRDLQDAKELLGMSWEHFRSQVEST